MQNKNVVITILNLGNVILGKMITLAKMENVGITALLIVREEVFVKECRVVTMNVIVLV
ncbi:hypothetical protein Godav_029251, partial [Gossypium davidsonii]|nr:hypothetical protein [Gossypium davidsonii]MBA0669827.1 hypothetical protein [Gossypium klotzschianum]